MNNQIDITKINVFPNNILLVSSFYTKADKSRKPLKMILNVALDKNKANSVSCEFPIHIKACDTYLSKDHLEMLKLFKSGELWIPVKCENLRVFCKKVNNQYQYVGHADAFHIVDSSEVTYD